MKAYFFEGFADDRAGLVFADFDGAAGEADFIRRDDVGAATDEEVFAVGFSADGDDDAVDSAIGLGGAGVGAHASAYSGKARGNQLEPVHKGEAKIRELREVFP